MDIHKRKPEDMDYDAWTDYLGYKRGASPVESERNHFRKAFRKKPLFKRFKHFRIKDENALKKASHDARLGEEKV